MPKCSIRRLTVYSCIYNVCLLNITSGLLLITETYETFKIQISVAKIANTNHVPYIGRDWQPISNPARLDHT